jgi:hypothetical protein
MAISNGAVLAYPSTVRRGSLEPSSGQASENPYLDCSGRLTRAKLNNSGFSVWCILAKLKAIPRNYS